MRLYQISEALGVDILDFFKGLEKGAKVSDVSLNYSNNGNDPNRLQPLDKEEIVLLKLFKKIGNKKLRASVLNQLRGIIELETKK